jgi:hypothetical protein
MSERSNVVQYASPNDRVLFETVCSMEDGIVAIENFADAIAIMTEAMDNGPMASALGHLAWEIKGRVRDVEDLRGKLFHMTHPNRKHFESEGWPGGRAA